MAVFAAKTIATMILMGFCQLKNNLRFKVQGSGFRVQGSRFWVQGSGFWVQGSRFRVQGSRFWVLGSGFWVQPSRQPKNGQSNRKRNFDLVLS
jgi:hypothetical protein